MPVHTYTNWNQRPSDQEEQIEPFRKYFFICEGANTETFYFKHLIDLRKELGIHPLIDIRLWEKTEEDKNISFAKRLVAFAEEQKMNPDNGFDADRDKMVIVFDGDIFEAKVQGYDELLATIEKNDIAAVTNPNFELFLILHIEGSYEKYIKGHEEEFLTVDDKDRYSRAYFVLHELTGTESRMKNGQRSICPWTRAAWKPDKKSELNSWGSSTPKPLDSVRFGVTLAVPQKRAACPKIMRLLSGRK